MMTALEWIWNVLVIASCLGLAVVHLASLRWGAINGITAGPHAILRKETPGKFWRRWVLLAFPYVLLPTFITFGFLVTWIDS